MYLFYILCFIKGTKTLSAMSFATYDVERRTRKGSFYAQADTIIDWNPISAVIGQTRSKRTFRFGRIARGRS
ncbi:hypothetical protein [Capnocytophaga canimorsus]|uniref:hypothetical protein n=1 Tax=Capnocytophaga canimorsus TaxID=28188 RepID=UPI0018E33E72|nr:hypothetical protein [Capnocytophaga canimorsus]